MRGIDLSSPFGYVRSFVLHHRVAYTTHTQAVATAALQGAASASQGNGFACHINAVLLPRRVMCGSGIACLKDDVFSTCVCPPDLPPLMMEGTGYLDPVCTPGMVADRGESSMKGIKAMKTESSLFDESVAHALMPRQFVHRDGSVSFYKYAVHWCVRGAHCFCVSHARVQLLVRV